MLVFKVVLKRAWRPAGMQDIEADKKAGSREGQQQCYCGAPNIIAPPNDDMSSIRVQAETSPAEGTAAAGPHLLEGDVQRPEHARDAAHAGRQVGHLLRGHAPAGADADVAARPDRSAACAAAQNTILV